MGSIFIGSRGLQIKFSSTISLLEDVFANANEQFDKLI